MNTCVRCGKEVEENVNVCPHCGLRNLNLTEDQSETENTFIQVEGGTFIMGSNARLETEKPEHMVTISSYYINKFAVTQKEWVSIMGTNPSEIQGDDFPVENVSWYDAVIFCNKKSLKDDLDPCYVIEGDLVGCNWHNNGYRLPTEAEWEYAMRGGKLSRNFEYSGSDDINEVAWYCDNSEWQAHPVGVKKPNELGLYDMSGNVYEWCWDIYGPYTIEEKTDPKGPGSGANRVFRGGSWSSKKDYCTVSNRYYNIATNHVFNIGLRLVRTTL